MTDTTYTMPASVTHPITPQQAESLAGFLSVAKLDPDFDFVVTVFELPHCGLWLADGSDVPCLAVAYDSAMDAYSVCEASGRVCQYLSGEVY